MIAITCDVYLVAWVVTGDTAISNAIATLCLCGIALLWYAIPLSAKWRSTRK
jgi:hypothetical protein